MVEYWNDVSLGSVDISTSQIFGWIELDMERKDAGGVPRSTLIDAAIAAARRDGLDPVTGFHSQVAVFTHNWSKDGAPIGVDWSDPVWGSFWIDGSADASGRVSSPPVSITELSLLMKWVMVLDLITILLRTSSADMEIGIA
ncbi:MAG: hypothetical protein WKG06_26395 [Segetibacter sp.]